MKSHAVVFVQPGEVVMVSQPTRVRTVLGSCVAITMRAPLRGLAAMAHCVLPSAGLAPGGVPWEDSGRYVDSAVERMLDSFARRGVGAGELEVKLFGGANHLRDVAAISGLEVGRRNVAAALSALDASGLRPVSHGVGGRVGRVVEFDTETGDVFVRRLPGAGKGHNR